jgi:hypothetical protein
MFHGNNHLLRPLAIMVWVLHVENASSQWLLTASETDLGFDYECTIIGVRLLTVTNFIYFGAIHIPLEDYGGWGYDGQDIRWVDFIQHHCTGAWVIVIFSFLPAASCVHTS